MYRESERTRERERKHVKSKSFVDDLAQGELECIYIYGHCNISNEANKQTNKHKHKQSTHTRHHIIFSHRHRRLSIFFFFSLMHSIRFIRKTVKRILVFLICNNVFC